mmetsp:Transcript_43555/g.139954  ORF Transcript_43555/g.139954 Transcript_43555/m.139954 type:complete len:298 (+) Transcript_43555:1961-2854(+)
MRLDIGIVFVDRVTDAKLGQSHELGADALGQGLEVLAHLQPVGALHRLRGPLRVRVLARHVGRALVRATEIDGLSRAHGRETPIVHLNHSVLLGAFHLNSEALRLGAHGVGVCARWGLGVERHLGDDLFACGFVLDGNVLGRDQVVQTRRLRHMEHVLMGVLRLNKGQQALLALRVRDFDVHILLHGARVLAELDFHRQAVEGRVRHILIIHCDAGAGRRLIRRKVQHQGNVQHLVGAMCRLNAVFEKIRLEARRNLSPHWLDADEGRLVHRVSRLGYIGQSHPKYREREREGERRS